MVRRLEERGHMINTLLHILPGVDDRPQTIEELVAKTGIGA